MASENLPLEPEFLQSLTRIFEEGIVFNRTLGLKITSIQAHEVRARIEMRNELVGHYSYNRIHGRSRNYWRLSYRNNRFSGC